MDRDHGGWGRTRTLAAALGALALLSATACTGDDGPAPAEARDRGGSSLDDAPVASCSQGASEEEAAPYPVETTTLALVDDSRPTDHPDDQWDLPSRALPTVVYVPQGEGPFPLVVQAHGFEGHPRKFTQLMTAWAAAGYVVAVPTFPLTNDESAAPAVLADYANQPADVSFVIDRILELSAGDDPILGDRVDCDRVGVSGHSLGGATAYGLAFNDCCRDERIDAVILMSTLPLPFDGGTYDLGNGTPLLLLQITTDPLVPYDAAVTAYDEAIRPKFLVTLEGGLHPEPYEDAPSPHDAVVETATVAFWDAYLGEDATAVDRLVEAADTAPSVSLAASP